MNDIRELIRKLVELNSAQEIEKVIVRQAGIYGNISIDSVHVEDDFAVIETEVLETEEVVDDIEAEDPTKETEEVSQKEAEEVSEDPAEEKEVSESVSEKEPHRERRKKEEAVEEA